MSHDQERIEERIEDTRARLSENLGELGDRMSPGSIMDEALRYFDTGPKEFAGSLGNQVRENPMGALLTAAGVAWMALGRGKDPARRYTEPSAHDYRDPHAVGDDDDDDDHGYVGASYRGNDDDGDRTYSRFDSDSYGTSTSGTGDTGPSAASLGRDYDLSDDEMTVHRSSIDRYDAVRHVRTNNPRLDTETDSDYYRRLDDTYASTLQIERTEGEDDDTYRARVRAAVDTASDKARDARQTLKRSAGRARQRMVEMRRQAGGYAADMSDEAAYRARVAKRRAAEFHDENPLVSGAISLAVGALAGSLFPVSEKERDALRPVADDLIERGAAMAEQGADRVEAYASKVEKKTEDVRQATSA